MSSPNMGWFDPNQQQAQAIGYNGQIYYSRSAPTTPYGQPAVLLPTPPIAVSPLPQFFYPQVWPQTPGNLAAPVSLPNVVPVLLDVLNTSGSSANWRQQGPPTLYYDLRDHPSRAQVTTHPRSLLSRGHLQAGVTSPPTQSMKIISKLFPWEIDVQSENPNSPITVEDLITAVHETLWKHMTGSEWWIVTEEVRTKVSAVYARNADVSTAGESRKKAIVEKPRHKKEGLRRIDFLLDNVVMKGLERDDAFVATRIRDKDARAQTWVLVVGPL